MSSHTRIENRIWRVAATLAVLLMDRFMTRALVFALPGFLIALFSETVGPYMAALTVLGGLLWAIADLARGVHTDYREEPFSVEEVIHMRWEGMEWNQYD